MSVKIVSKKAYFCTCELCGAKWTTKEFRVPPRCTSCGSYRWNGVDRRCKVDSKPTKPSKQAQA
jgi:hypothetical protein